VDQPNDVSFRFLQDIATDLTAGDVSFPTLAAATVAIRGALDDPAVDADRLARVIAREPLLAVRVVRLANSAAINPGGKPIADVRTAVIRVGHASLRSLAIAVAFDQLRADQALHHFRAKLEGAWRHSVQVASLSFILASKLTRIPPDEALFAGLVHDIGYFYLLSRAPRYPELDGRPGDLDGILREWHASIGQAVLHSYALPAAVMDAVGEHESATPRMPPRTIADVVCLANAVAAETNPVRDRSQAAPPIQAPQLADLLAQSREQLGSLVSALHS
jgi:putative nucleotidyltransferase with HDIG domain